jgi:hypothetical protein
MGTSTPKNYRAEISSIPKSDVRKLCVNWAGVASDDEAYSHRLYFRVRKSPRPKTRSSRAPGSGLGHDVLRLSPPKGQAYIAAWLTYDPAVLFGARAAIATIRSAITWRDLPWTVDTGRKLSTFDALLSGGHVLGGLRWSHVNDRQTSAVRSAGPAAGA